MPLGKYVDRLQGGAECELCQGEEGLQHQLVIQDNWLQVLGTAELAQIHQCVRHQLHPIVPLLDTFKS
jgi:hypothetical protein